MFILLLSFLLIIFKYSNVLFMVISLEVLVFYTLVFYCLVLVSFSYFVIFLSVIGSLFCLLFFLVLVKSYGSDLVCFTLLG